MSAASKPGTGSAERRKDVDAALSGFTRRRSLRRVAPPEGRLGPTDFPIQQLRVALASLGPVFASFGRYLATRRDLLPRRDCVELSLIPDAAPAADPGALAAHLHRQLGAPPSRRFFQFDPRAYDVRLWTERHDAWVAPGVPAIVTVLRPDAAELLDGDVPLLPMLQEYLGIEPVAYADALADFGRTLRMRLDQTFLSSAMVTIAAHADAEAFAVPTCYRDHCAAGVLTLDRWEGYTVAQLFEDRGLREDLARTELAKRLAVTWLRQAFAGRVMPFDFDSRDIVLTPDDRLMLIGAAFEPLGSADRGRLARYFAAVAGDDPEAAASWLLDAATVREHPPALDEEVRRRFRQAVPFRDGEWSGDDRFAENLMVQWRVAREAGWRFTPHHLHAYRGFAAVAAMTHALAPQNDSVLEAFQDVRLRRGVSNAASMLDPAAIGSRFDTALREMVTLPQKLDEVLTLAAEGRLRVKLQVPETNEGRRVRQQTILMIAAVVLFAAIASLVRHAAPAYGPGLERIGVVALVAVGGWLLIAAARL
jgi:predicted unusual protein kinase regulating ubiquinone biosynthesis (AarF/ABC1/UbiB family)